MCPDCNLFHCSCSFDDIYVSSSENNTFNKKFKCRPEIQTSKNTSTIKRQNNLIFDEMKSENNASHLFSQNPATKTENSAQSRSEHIFMELTLFVYNINSQNFCIKSGLNYLRHKRYNRNETEGHIFFCNLNFHRNGIYILYINCYHHREIYILH